MFFRREVVEESHHKLAEKIKRDLLRSLQKKGVEIAKVQVDMKTGNMNVEVLIGDKCC